VFIDFEGIDGSGKTTLSNLLAARLARMGYTVAHAREGGELRSPIARRIRELTRDSTLLEMGPRTEFFLNLARDAQQLEEVIAPALARGEVCISDRYLYSQMALTGGGRGLYPSQLEGPCALASQGIWPDLVILVDVEPDLARLRKRLGKSKTERAADSDSRKGLAGAGLAVRMRESFRQMALADPERWIILENNDQPLHVLEQRLVDAVVARLEGRQAELPEPRPTPAPSAPRCLDEVEEHFLRALDEVEAREPQLAVWMLGGLPGLAAHQRRLSCVERFPGLTVRSLAGLEDEPACALRELLAEVVPRDVAASLGTGRGPQSMALRERLFAQAPTEVLSGLKFNDSAEAWSLRQRALGEDRLADVLCGLAGLDHDAAWAVRALGVQRGLAGDVARSLTGLGSERADALREQLLPQARLAVLRSTDGLSTPFAWRLRTALENKARKVVLRSLYGLDTPEAWILRERGAPLTKEALDSVDGLDGERAWALRETFVRRWPATVVSSLVGLPLTARVEELALRALADTHGRLPVLHKVYALVAAAHAATLAPERQASRAHDEALPRLSL
jgi:dTMP kinase